LKWWACASYASLFDHFYELRIGLKGFVLRELVASYLVATALRKNLDSAHKCCGLRSSTSRSYVAKGIFVQSRLAPRRRISNPVNELFSGVFDLFSLG
jgi:hypothetical protein